MTNWNSAFRAIFAVKFLEVNDYFIVDFDRSFITYDKADFKLLHSVKCELNEWVFFCLSGKIVYTITNLLFAENRGRNREKKEDIYTDAEVSSKLEVRLL